ncbi:hypothetical protein M0R45_034328 [Rubus argutus]|uniref:Uncharacterized protein n=1 Tax=Rubus argutus TaxID=59490 RepID=A0AAW1VTH7_RUBAR
MDNKVDYVLTEPKPPKPTDATPQNNATRYYKWVYDWHILLLYMDQTAKSLVDTHRRLHQTLDVQVPAHKMAEGRSINEQINKMRLMEKSKEACCLQITVVMVGLWRRGCSDEVKFFCCF